MKVRSGFVSNSSSSSFYVAVKTDETLTREGLLKLLGIPADSQGAKFFSTIIEEIVAGETAEIEDERENDSQRANFKTKLDELQRQLADSEADYRKETDLTTQYARALLSNIKQLKVEIKEIEDHLAEVEEAYDQESPFPELKGEEGWKILEVITDETEGIGSLGCDVLKVSWR